VPVGGPGEVITLCTRQESIEEPAWSPDGTRIVFTSRERTRRYSDGDDDRARPPRHIDGLLSCLDGEGWIADRPRSVFVVPADGSGEPRIVAGGPFEHASPVWSPDGRTLAVVAARGKDRDLELVNDVYLVRPDDTGGSEPRRLTNHDLSHAYPSFSPDGTRIATLAVDERIVVVQPPGCARRRHR